MDAARSSTKSERLPSVSVVIPSYNHSAYIEQAVDSVLAQEIEGLQLIVIDDGSTDDSRQKLERYRDLPGVEIQTQENQGAHATLNRGLDQASGELLLILNSDDVWEPNRVADLQARFAERPELILATTWLRVVDGAGETLAIKEAYRNLPPWPAPRPGPSLNQLEDPALALLQSNYISTTSNVAFHRRLWDRGVRFQDLRYTHDWDFVLAACQLGEIEIVPEPSVQYRVHGENTIREGTDLGKGMMRFEILWSVARHAPQLLARAVEQGHDRADLERRFWNSAPRFSHESLLAQLLALRGGDPQPGSAYDALVRPGHALREAAVRQLATAPD